ncbi:putative regulator of chromosome condensation 1/beta-lactamase-inhibitor protein II [Helianthus annuus]|nr:putative regulator of chromosome condensation 1/beta-lactamase-inhibitor protein II [Helianthus annuus]
MNIANTGRSVVLLLIFLLGGFILPKTQIANWWEWAYWLSPLLYIFKAITINEFLDSRWASQNYRQFNKLTLCRVKWPHYHVYHSLALLKGEHGDQVYGFGSAKRGQLRISKEKVKSVSLPQSVSGLQEVDVSSISANGDNSAALSSDAHLYTSGRGFGGTPDMCSPNRVISRYSFKQAALGWNHALLLTDEGYILMLGGSHHGILSNPQKEISVNQGLDEGQGQEIPGLDRIKLAGVASRSEHSVITTERQHHKF